ncbi:MAG TPA: 3'-5' exonuclease [bacterium]|nr:3'-5' exonuclease [bacterium]HPN32787.1 3'-5' exonuclease [bacterium]
MKLSNLNSKSLESIVLNLIKNRFENLNEDNYELFFSSEYFLINNPFKTEGFESFILKLKKILNSQSSVSVEYSDNGASVSGAIVLKKLFEFLKCKTVETKLSNRIKSNESITVSIDKSFKINFREMPDKQCQVILLDNLAEFNLNKISLALSIYNITIGILYSFDETFGKEMIAFDLEATGLSKLDELTEIGALKIRNGVISSSFQTLINPERSIPFGIQELTHITPDMVKPAPKISEAIRMFYDFAGTPDYVVVHNGGFDVSSIRTRYKKYLDKNFQPKVYDTRALSQSVKPGSGLDLSSLSHEFSIILKNAHRALADAEATAKVFSKLIFFRNAGISYFLKNNLYKFCGICFNEINKRANNIDFRILFRAAILDLSRSNKKKVFSELCLPLKIKSYLSITETFSTIKSEELAKLLDSKENPALAKPATKINLLKYLDAEKTVNLNISDISKVFAYIINDFYPFDSLSNKYPVFVSDKLTYISKDDKYFYLKENGKKIKIINTGGVNIKDGRRLVYRIDYEKYGLFKMFARIKIYPLKILN